MKLIDSFKSCINRISVLKYEMNVHRLSPHFSVLLHFEVTTNKYDDSKRMLLHFSSDSEAAV